MLARGFRVLFLPVTLSLVLTTGCYAPAASGDKEESVGRQREEASCVSSLDTDRLADRILQLVNLERAASGLPPVVANPVLEKIAGDYACLMITEQFFAHQDPLTGRGPGQRAVAGKYAFYAVGENLVAGPESAAEAMKIWMQSPTHRDNILDPRWKEVGVTVRLGGDYDIYWVLEFGDPAGTFSTP